MKRRHIIACGRGHAGAARSETDRLSLDLHGPDPNVSLKIESISTAMAGNIPAVLLDLVEIATYVYAADQAVGRGSPTDEGDRWRRDLEIHLAVRQPDFWSKPDVTAALIDVLSFLSEDDYTFEFDELRNPAPVQLYLDLEQTDWNPGIERVLLFSGGADSLAGAVKTALTEKKNVVLVSHRSAPKRMKRVDELAHEIATRAAPSTVQHVPIWATKAESVGREYTQRTRSFLYAALATTVASMLGLHRIEFFENGVTSMNLPIAPQVVGSRAARTTHPQTIRGFARLFSLILGRTFHVETPFLWLTKTDVMGIAKRATCGDLIRSTVSCSRTVETTKMHSHCGRCSQCIDRRFAALAAGLDDSEDPPEMYKVDLLVGERAPGEDRAMIEAFVERARLMRELGDIEFFARFPEATRVLRHTDLSSTEAAGRVLDLHRRHGAEVGDVLARGLKENADEFQAGRLPDSCLLVLAVPERYRSTLGPGDELEGPTFVREGDFWRVSFGNETRRLKDSIGMRYIALLLQAPGYEFHCAELIRVEAGAISAPRSVRRDPSLHGPRGEEPPVPEGNKNGSTAVSSGLTDQRTVRECRRRLEEIDAEIGQAHANGESDRELSLKDEAKAIREYLRSVTGLGGLPRKASDENEKARKSVANAVSRALKHVERKKHLPLWRHLRKHLKTGTYCVYSPDSPIRWVVSI